MYFVTFTELEKYFGFCPLYRHWTNFEVCDSPNERRMPPWEPIIGMPRLSSLSWRFSSVLGVGPRQGERHGFGDLENTPLGKTGTDPKRWKWVRDDSGTEVLLRPGSSLPDFSPCEKRESKKEESLFFSFLPFFHHFTPFFDQNAKTTNFLFFPSTFFPFSQAHFTQSGTTLAQGKLGWWLAWCEWFDKRGMGLGPCALTLVPVRCRCHCRCRSHCVVGEVVVLVLVVWFCVCEYVCVVFVVCCVRESESGCLCWLYLRRVFCVVLAGSFVETVFWCMCLWCDVCVVCVMCEMWCECKWLCVCVCSCVHMCANMLMTLFSPHAHFS